MIIATKPIDPGLLATELTTAGVAHQGLSVADLGGQIEILTADLTGALVDLPPEAVPVVDAHVAPPRVVEFARGTEIDAVIRTTDGTVTALLRFPLATLTGYDVEAKVMGVDAGNGAVKKLKVDVTMKRLNAAPSVVGAPTTTVTHQDPAASAWVVGFSFVGNDAVVSVTGAAGRSIDWICRAAVGQFSPGGLEG